MTTTNILVNHVYTSIKRVIFRIIIFSVAVFKINFSFPQWKIKVAIKLAPDRKKFMEVLGHEGDIQGDMLKFCTNFSPILAQIHKFLVRCQLRQFWYNFKTHFKLGTVSLSTLMQTFLNAGKCWIGQYESFMM